MMTENIDRLLIKEVMNSLISGDEETARMLFDTYYVKKNNDVLDSINASLEVRNAANILVSAELANNKLP